MLHRAVLFAVLSISCFTFAQSSLVTTPPTATDIALIRESWNVAKTIPTIPTNTLIELFKTHPTTQKLFSKFSTVPLAYLHENDAFIKQARVCISFGFNFIVDNMDNMELLQEMMKNAGTYGNWFVDSKISQDEQTKEFVRIFLVVLEQEMGSRLSSQAKAAWSRGLKYVFSSMMTQPSLSASDISLVRQSYASIQENSNIAPKIFLRLFELHPATQKLFPKFANVSFASLPSNNEFLIQTHTCMSGFFFIVHSLDKDEMLTKVLSNAQQFNHGLVSYVDPADQFDEFARIMMEVVEEEGVLTKDANAAWKKALNHVFGIMKEAHTSKSKLCSATIQSARKSTSVLSSNVKSIIYDTWALARRNSDIAPNFFLAMFKAHPETQNLFPRLAKVPFSELSNNRDFFQLTYNCFYGISWIVKNLDDAELISSQLRKHVSAAWLVEQTSPAQQLEETGRLLLEVMKQEVGEAFTEEAAAAWKHLFAYIHDILQERNQQELQPLNKDDRDFLRDGWHQVKRNKDFGAKFLLKLFRAHPSIQTMIPKLANVPFSSLMSNSDFVAFGKMVMVGLDLIEYIDDPNQVSHVMAGKPYKSFFLPNIPISLQLEETTRILLELLDEEMGSRFTQRTREVWSNAQAHFNRALLSYL